MRSVARHHEAADQGGGPRTHIAARRNIQELGGGTGRGCVVNFRQRHTVAAIDMEGIGTGRERHQQSRVRGIRRQRKRAQAGKRCGKFHRIGGGFGPARVFGQHRAIPE